MARLLVGAAFGIVVGTVFGAALGLHADDVQAEVSEAAAAAHVDPVNLQGAVNSTGVDPYTYLRSTGELPPITRPPAASTASPPVLPAVSVWQRLAQCESSGRWDMVDPPYYGGLQEDLVFWRRHGGLQYASRPDLATRTAQIAVAQQGLSVQGWGAWANCSRRLGLV